MMNMYVLAFAFDDLGRIALIKKKRPEWQAGRYNGIGGKINEGETPQAAMSREFLEETSVEIQEDRWKYRGIMIGSVGFTVYVYTLRDVLVRDVKTTTDEQVVLLPLWSMRSLEYHCIENVHALIELCRIPAAEPSNVIPTFSLRY